MNIIKSLFIFLLTAIFISSCSDSPTSSLPTSGQIKLSVKSINAPGGLAKISAANITEARLVIGKIKFQSIFEDSLDFRLKQPFIQNLTVGTGLHRVESVEVPFGSYKETEIEIDDLDAEDGSVYIQNPELQDRSILVKGYMNDDPAETFVFSSDLEAEQEREFRQPLVLDENSPSTNIVLTIDMSQWFSGPGGEFLDPTDEVNRETIEKNIKTSIDVFEDDDDNGEDDDYDDGDEDDHDDGDDDDYNP